MVRISDFIKAEWAGWTDKIKYLTKVTGEDIEEEYNEMNTSGTKHISATVTHLLDSLPPDPPLYDCFIYYKNKTGWVKGLD